MDNELAPSLGSLAQQSYLSAQLNRVNDRAQQLRASVELYQALGGGWK